MAIGIQAIGEIGRRIWKIGLSVRYAPCTQPIHRPSGIATSTASPKPSADAHQRGADVLPQRAVARPAPSAPVTTAHGVGKDHAVGAHDHPPPQRDDQRDDHAAAAAMRAGQLSRRLLRCSCVDVRPHAVRAAPAQARPSGVAGASVHDDGHLPARVRGAGEAGIRRPPRTAAGSSGRASSARARTSAARRRGCAAAARRCTPERQADVDRAGFRPCRRPCGAPRCPSGSRTARRARHAAIGANAAQASSAAERRQRPMASDHDAQRLHLRASSMLQVVRRNRRPDGRTASARAAGPRGRSGRWTTNGSMRSQLPSPLAIFFGDDAVALAHGVELPARCRCRR